MGVFEFVISKGKRRGTCLPFPGPRFRVGAGPACALQMPEPGVADQHLEIWVAQDGLPRVRDVSGVGDLLLDGAPAHEGVLSPGSFVAFGGVELVLREPARAAGPSGTMARLGATPPQTSTVTARISQRRSVLSAVEMGDDEEDQTEALGATLLSSVLPPGTVVDGRYEIVGKLAEGGMGEVYRAQHVELGKQLALKVMRPELSADPEFVTRFKREAVAASQIGQQNIIDVSDFGRTSAGRFYFVMEYVDGQTLDALVREAGALPPQRAVYLVTQVARALGAAHAKGIVHRDLKPENVMVLQRPGQPDFVKVLDFGVAKVATRKGQPGQTAVGMVVGTPQYMAPEQAQGTAVDARSDIYALGLILYELLSGRPTFDAETSSMLIVKHVTEQPPPFPDEVSARVPQALQALAFQMLEKVPSARPQSMEDVCEALAGEATTASLGPRPIPARANRPVSGARVPAVAASVVRPPEAGKQQSVSRQAPARAPGREDALLPVPSESSEAMGPRRVITTVLVVAAVLGCVAVVVLLAGKDEDGKPGAARTEVRSKMLDRAHTAIPAPAPAPAAPALPADPAAVARPAFVRMRFTSAAEPFRVFEGDIALGSTPLVLERSRGTLLELTFRAEGFKESLLKVRFESDQEFPVTMERLKAPVAPVKRPGAGSGAAPSRETEQLKENPF